MTSTRYKLESAIWQRGIGQRIAWFVRCQLIITWYHRSKKYKENQGHMSLSTYYLEYAWPPSRHRRRAYAPTSNTASHDNHEKINSWVSFNFLHGYGAPLGGHSGRRSSTINVNLSKGKLSSWTNNQQETNGLGCRVKYKKAKHIHTAIICVSVLWEHCLPFVPGQFVQECLWNTCWARLQ